MSSSFAAKSRYQSAAPPRVITVTCSGATPRRPSSRRMNGIQYSSSWPISLRYGPSRTGPPARAARRRARSPNSARGRTSASRRTAEASSRGVRAAVTAGRAARRSPRRGRRASFPARRSGSSHRADGARRRPCSARPGSRHGAPRLGIEPHLSPHRDDSGNPRLDQAQSAGEHHRLVPDGVHPEHADPGRVDHPAGDQPVERDRLHRDRALGIRLCDPVEPQLGLDTSNCTSPS